MSLSNSTRPYAADLAGLAGAWRLEPADSTVEFTGRHFFFLPVKGSLPVRAGRCELGADGKLLRLQVAVGAAGFESGNPQRDTAVRGAKFLDAERFPELRYTGERADIEGGLSVNGLLGVMERQVPVPFTVDEISAEGDGHVVVRATARVDRHPFGVSAMRGMVGATLDVRVRAVFVRQA